MMGVASEIQASASRTRSLLVEGRNCWRIAHADRVAFLIDAADYFAAFAAAAVQAQHSIFIIAWDFNSQIRLWQDDGPVGVPPVLGDFLNHLVKRRRRLKIHILDWDFPMVYGADREFPPLFGLGWKHRRRIRLHFDSSLPLGASHHQKIVVIDDAIAFVGGLDLTGSRWDTSEHRGQDARRVYAGKPYPPFHDGMMAVDGAAAQALAEIAVTRWKRATGETIRPSAQRYDVWPPLLRPDITDVDVGIARTEPVYDGNPGVREIEALYIDAIAAAKHSIYIENQYFTSASVGAALAARLEEESGPEIVAVLRKASDGWLEGPTMGALRAELIKKLRAADRAQRLSLYYPTVPDLGDQCCNVHAKFLVIDDQVLRIGSANLNNRSMGLDTECDLVVTANGDPRIAAAIAGFRNRLLAEHLGTSELRVAEILRTGTTISDTVRRLSTGERRLEPLEDEHWPAAVVSLAEVTDPEQPLSPNQLVEHFAPELDSKTRGYLGLKITIAVLICVGLVAAWRYTPLKEYVTVEAVLAWVGTLKDNPWAPLVLIGAYILATFTFFPRPLLALGAVIAFGPWFRV